MTPIVGSAPEWWMVTRSLRAVQGLGVQVLSP